jgi:uncharacterized protein YjdB
MSVRRRTWVACWLVVLGACAADGPVTPRVATVTVGPAAPAVRVGGTITLAAELRDAAGATIPATVLTWSSSAPAVATVSATGVVSALTPGTARIAASAFGRSGTTTVTVLPREVVAVQLSPSTLALRPGASAPLTARPVDADGALVPGRPVSWSTSAAAVATVSAAGVVTGVAPGTATITATSDGRSAQVAVTVSPPPVATITLAPAVDTMVATAVRSFTATLRDAGGAVLTGRTVTWSTGNPAVALVSSTGVVTALAPGTTTVTASSEGQVGRATLVVLARLASAVTLTPAAMTLVAGATQQLAAQVTDGSGNILPERPITYRSDAPAIATVSATGLVTAVAPGQTRIVATSEGRTGAATVVVLPVPVATVAVAPATSTLAVGGTVRLVATARAAGGQLLTGRTVTFTSGAPAVATVAATGVVTAVAPGTAVVLATVEGVTGSATITVTRPAVASVAVTPQGASVLLGGLVPLSATALDAQGAPLADRVITWSSADEGIAFVSATGQVVGVRRGSVLVTATVEGVRGTTLVTVR